MRLYHLYYCFLFFTFTNCEIARQEERQSKVTSNTNVAAVSEKQSDPSIGLKIGQIAPDISLPDPQGTVKTLSSLRGKYILLDFWASWCGPCRFENPNVVRQYQKYKGTDFDILSVSLDSDKQKWLDAIEADGMEWNHISDLKKWESSVVPLYNLAVGIPMTFLLDKNGVIIAKNLRGPDLEKKLEEILKK